LTACTDEEVMEAGVGLGTLCSGAAVSDTGSGIYSGSRMGLVTGCSGKICSGTVF
jgi:hypothetical protein